MGSLERFASKIVNANADDMKVWTRPDGEVVVAEDGYETGNGDMWSGPIGAWQAALLAAISAKVVEGTLVIVASPDSTGAERDAYADEIANLTERSVIVLRHDWQAIGREEAEQALRSIIGTKSQEPIIEHNGKFYFHDETWSDACGPYDTREAANSACSRYAEWLEDGVVRELGGTWGHRLNVRPHYDQLTDWVRAQPSGTFLLIVAKKQTELQRFDLRDAKRKIVLSLLEAEFSTASFISGVDYHAVWISRNVSPECEAKIPRGVKVYRER